MNGNFYTGGGYSDNSFPGTGLDGNTVPNQQSVPSYQDQYTQHRQYPFRGCDRY